MNLLQKIKALYSLNRILSHTITEAKKMDGLTPGYKTTEFYLTLLTNIVTIVGTLKGVIPEHIGATIIAAANGLYGVLRTFAKKES